MGLFDFVTEAGSKLGGKIYDVVHKDEPDQSVTKLDPIKVNDAREKSITANIEESGVQVEGLQVLADGKTATLKGTVNSQACSEKLTLIAGNQFGIGTVDCQLVVETPEPESQLYTVKSGDTLSKIAKAFYGDASKYPVIFEANQPMLENPDKIFVGQNLRIPAV